MPCLFWAAACHGLHEISCPPQLSGAHKRAVQGVWKLMYRHLTAAGVTQRSCGTNGPFTGGPKEPRNFTEFRWRLLLEALTHAPVS